MKHRPKRCPFDVRIKCVGELQVHGGTRTRMTFVLGIFKKLKRSRRFFENSSDIKFNQNPSSGSRVVPCGRTDMTKLIVAFRNFANAPYKLDDF
jgi:hypothetical protein